MIFDAHMHVGDFGPMMNVGVDTAGIAELMREHEIDGGVIFHPDSALVEQCLEAIPGLYGLVWANPKQPGYLEETERLLEQPRWRGIKLHPLIDGFHPNDPAVHPLMELLVDARPAGADPLRPSDLQPAVEHRGAGGRVPDGEGDPRPHGALQRRLHQRRDRRGRAERERLPRDVGHADADEDPRGGRARRDPIASCSGRTSRSTIPKIEIDRVHLSGLSPELVERVLSTNARALFLGEQGVASAAFGRFS